MSAPERGVAIVRCEYGDNTPASYWEPGAAERIGFPVKTQGRWFDATEAAALVDVAEAARAVCEFTGYPQGALSDAVAALDRLDAARGAS